MNRGKHAKKTGNFGNILYWMVGILLAATMLSTSLVGGLFAKYIISGDIYDSARVASTGIGKLEVLEHRARETGKNSGVYELLTQGNPVTKNKYRKVLPGVDIPKDPFIELELKNAEVDYELYIKVTESATKPNPFPEGVTYSLTDNWQYVRTEDDGTKIYRYVEYNEEEKTQAQFIFEAGKPYSFTYEAGNAIKLLKKDMLFVSEQYVGTDAGEKIEFWLTFSAYLMQVKAN